MKDWLGLLSFTVTAAAPVAARAPATLSLGLGELSWGATGGRELGQRQVAEGRREAPLHCARGGEGLANGAADFQYQDFLPLESGVSTEIVETFAGYSTGTVSAFGVRLLTRGGLGLALVYACPLHSAAGS